MNPTVNSIIYIVFQDGSSAWYLNINETAVMSSAFTCNAIIRAFKYERSVEEYTPNQSDTVRKYTTYKFIP